MKTLLKYWRKLLIIPAWLVVHIAALFLTVTLSVLALLAFRPSAIPPVVKQLYRDLLL